MLSSPVRITTKKKSVVLAAGLPPRVPALSFGRSLPRIAGNH